MRFFPVILVSLLLMPSCSREKTYNQTGHEHTEKIKEEIFSFFRNCMKETIKL